MSRAPASIPRPVEALPCGSRSTISTRAPESASAAPRLIVVVVLPTPPFWLAIAMMRGAFVRAGSGTGYSCDVQDDGGGVCPAFINAGGELPLALRRCEFLPPCRPLHEQRGAAGGEVALCVAEKRDEIGEGAGAHDIGGEGCRCFDPLGKDSGGNTRLANHRAKKSGFARV